MQSQQQLSPASTEGGSERLSNFELWSASYGFTGEWQHPALSAHQSNTAAGSRSHSSHTDEAQRNEIIYLWSKRIRDVERYLLFAEEQNYNPVIKSLSVHLAIGVEERKDCKWPSKLHHVITCKCPITTQMLGGEIMLVSLNNTASLRHVPSLVTTPSPSPVRRSSSSRSQGKAPDPSGIFE